MAYKPRTTEMIYESREKLDGDPLVRALRYTDTGAWEVYLPHQCDWWVVGAGETWQALTQLDTLLNELQAAQQAINEWRTANERESTR